jgi:SpoVK/Ycf46/Vps4 family AAA+-type ATPase
LEQLVLPPEFSQKLKNFVSYHKKTKADHSIIFTFYGTYDSLKKDVAAAICKEIKVSLMAVNTAALFNSEIPFEYSIDLIFRESNLLPCALFFHNLDFLFTENDSIISKMQYFIKKLDCFSALTFLASENALGLQNEFNTKNYIELELPVPEYQSRLTLWDRYLADYKLSDEIDTKVLAGIFSLTGGQIKNIVKTAYTFALWRSPDNLELSQQNIIDACHLHANQNLRQFAIRIKPKHTMDDLVLDKKNKKQLCQIVEMFTHKHIVYNEWGFDKKLSLGKGISALFYGSPGTGKTLSSDIIAHEVGMDLYKIDISTIISKYIGETEKNLAQIFREAETSNAILFFDEADAIFGKRTEVKDSHDRYANIEVSYLLQKIDEYNGIVIMATNYAGNIDEAFNRRINFIINFPFPDENSRYHIWNSIFPKETPLVNNLNFKLLAERLELSGGHIKNIALQAAFYASQTTGKVDMGHIIEASKNEFAKIGHLWRDIL